MATFHYFSDCEDGTSVELSTCISVNYWDLAKMLPGAKIVHIDNTTSVYVGPVKEGEDTSNAIYCPTGWFQGKHMMVVTRKVQFKPFPKLHECNAKCRSATRHICECRCRGKNHGHA